MLMIQRIVFFGFLLLKTVVGGISVSVDSHLWMADTQNQKAINEWIEQMMP